jgi:F0F1-type ATP synthase membrane subunit b/b'
LAENVSDAPAQILDQTRGAPLIAGGVALGIGVLIALVVPESEPERRVAQSLEPQIAAATDAAKEAGQEALEKAKSATQDAVGELKDAAGEHVQEVADQAKDAAESVAATARAEAEPGRD